MNTNPITVVFDVTKKALLKDPKYVEINWSAVDQLMEIMKKDGKPTPFVSQQADINQRMFILKELVACSINYCYWYGASDLRPNDTSSTLMYKLVDNAFDFIMIENDLSNFFKYQMDYLIKLLAVNRFPLLEDRVRHLKDLEQKKVNVFIDNVIEKKDNIVDMMIYYFPGFASDILMKRVSLFFIQLYRKYGWFADNENDLMYTLPVPADYQLPKILNYYSCMTYNHRLEEKIWENKLIKRHSLAEIQIRSATIRICDVLRRGLNADGWTIADVDTWIWTRRKETDAPFHCTITTDY